MYIYMYTYIYIHIYVCVCLCVHVCVYVNAYRVSSSTPSVSLTSPSDTPPQLDVTYMLISPRHYRKLEFESFKTHRAPLLLISFCLFQFPGGVGGGSGPFVTPSHAAACGTLEHEHRC